MYRFIPILGALLLQVTTQDPKFKLNVDVDLVELHVTVVDDSDRTVSGLQQENFLILEDRVDQPITVFKQEDLPVSLGLVIDNSRSMESRKSRVDAAALAFVRRSNAQDETFIIHFDDTARLVRDFTSSIHELEETLATNTPFGQTAIYDALLMGIEHMQRSKFNKKAILLITDGADNASRHSLEAAIERGKQSRVAVYPIGLLSGSPFGQQAARSLEQFAEASGGRAYFPQTVDEIQAIAERIARDLREQYTLGYVPTNTQHDGTWRSVRIELIPPAGSPRLIANYRRGYYAPDR